MLNSCSGRKTECIIAAEVEREIKNEELEVDSKTQRLTHSSIPTFTHSHIQAFKTFLYYE